MGRKSHPRQQALSVMQGLVTVMGWVREVLKVWEMSSAMRARVSGMHSTWIHPKGPMLTHRQMVHRLAHPVHLARCPAPFHPLGHLPRHHPAPSLQLGGDHLARQSRGTQGNLCAVWSPMPGAGVECRGTKGNLCAMWSPMPGAGVGCRALKTSRWSLWVLTGVED
jgi:hypothetical protein